MILAGRLLDRFGPRLTAAIGALLYGGGWVAASFSGGSFAAVLVSLGLVAGGGIGFGYVCPLAAGMRWMPDKRGLVTGVAVAGFGGGAVLLSAVAGDVLRGTDVLLFFRMYGICSGLILLAAALFISFPDEAGDGAESAAGGRRAPGLFFALVSAGMFVGTFSGLKIVGNLALISGQAGFGDADAILAISLFSIGNAGGRIGWGILYDRFGGICAPAALAVSAAASAALAFALPGGIFLAVIIITGFCFGANFVVFAGMISDHYGIAVFHRIYPLCFLFYGAAGLAAPALGGLVSDITGSYDPALIGGAVLLAGTAVLLRLKLPAAP